MNNIKIWDEVATNYEDYSYHEKDSNYPANKFRAKIILDFLKKQKQGRILDAGCGSGYLTRELTKHGWNCVGIDLSKNMLKIAKEKDIKENLKLDLRQCSVLDMRIFKDKEFDIIMLNGVLPYLNKEDEIKAYKECNRLLKDKGYLIISQYNAFFDFFMESNHELKKLITLPQEVKSDDRTMKYENPLTYKNKLKKYNFSEERQFYYNFHTLPSALTSKKDNLERMKLEEKLYNKWQGLFMAKTFISISRKS